MSDRWMNQHTMAVLEDDDVQWMDIKQLHAALKIENTRIGKALEAAFKKGEIKGDDDPKIDGPWGNKLFRRTRAIEKRLDKLDPNWWKQPIPELPMGPVEPLKRNPFIDPKPEQSSLPEGDNRFMKDRDQKLLWEAYAESRAVAQDGHITLNEGHGDEEGMTQSIMDTLRVIQQQEGQGDDPNKYWDYLPKLIKSFRDEFPLNKWAKLDDSFWSKFAKKHGRTWHPYKPGISIWGFHKKMENPYWQDPEHNRPGGGRHNEEPEVDIWQRVRDAQRARGIDPKTGEPLPGWRKPEPGEGPDYIKIR